MGAILSLNNRILSCLEQKESGLNLISRLGEPYIAGHTLEAGIATCKEYLWSGVYSSLDILGEEAKTKEDADRFFAGYCRAMDLFVRLREEEELLSFGNVVSISMKPSAVSVVNSTPTEISFSSETPLFDRLDEGMGYAYHRKLPVTIDMEDHRFTEATLCAARDLWLNGYSNTGIVLQSRLHRTEEDIERFLKNQNYHFPKEEIRVRLCIGIYQEPEDIAVTSKREAKKRLLSRLEELFDVGVYVEIATHDSHVINEAQEIIRRRGIPVDRYEFQFLKGVPVAERKIIPRLLDEGKTCRLYMPVEFHAGDGLPYIIRRCKANSWMVWYGVKNVAQGMIYGGNEKIK